MFEVITVIVKANVRRWRIFLWIIAVKTRRKEEDKSMKNHETEKDGNHI